MTFLIQPSGETDWQWCPRFATLEAAEKAMQGDLSGAEAPFEEKDYGPSTGKMVMLREAYKNAPYEMRYVSGKSPALSVTSPG